MVAKNPLLVTLLLAGLVARGTEARKAAIISGTVPCTARPNQANVILDISNNMINARTNNDGQFMAVLNVTSSNMMDSLMNGSKVVVVNTPPMACNSSLPADVGTLKLEAPVVPRGARILGVTPLDNTMRDIIDGQSYGVLSVHVYFLTRPSINITVDNLRQLTDRLPAGVSYSGDTLDAYAKF